MEAVITTTILTTISDTIISYLLPNTMHPIMPFIIKEIVGEIVTKTYNNDKKLSVIFFRKLYSKHNVLKMHMKIIDLTFHLYYHYVLYREKRHEDKLMRKKIKHEQIKRALKRNEQDKHDKKLKKVGFCKCDKCNHHVSAKNLKNQLSQYDVLTPESDIKLKCAECDSCMHHMDERIRKYGVTHTIMYLQKLSDRHDNIDLSEHKKHNKISEKSLS